MNFAVAFSSLLAGVTAAAPNRDADAQAATVRGHLVQQLALNGMEDPSRRLMDLHEDFSYFEGTWFDCLHTSLMTFNGEPAEKHMIEQVGCDFGELGTVTKVAKNDQTLQFDMLLLNHCWFHDLGGKGQPPCPDDILPSDSRGKGNVVVKYSFKGIGSFAESDKVHFFTDHLYLKDADGEWQPVRERAKIEDRDEATCVQYKEGMVCDIRINEYRSASRVVKDAGCLIDGECKARPKKKWGCENHQGGVGVWSEDCKTREPVPDGFVYDSFGSYYLVKDTSQCDVTCATSSPTVTPVAPEGPTPSPTVGPAISGCYRGGRCTGQHGCCDCDVTEVACKAAADAVDTMKPIWSSGCKDICFEGTD